jgi:nitroreductase
MPGSRARGLDTCPQAVIRFHRFAAQLALPRNEMVVCGVSLGHPDPRVPENRLVTEREPVHGFVRFVDGLGRRAIRPERQPTRGWFRTRS